jgi:DNA-binding response OmpR family regulator
MILTFKENEERVFQKILSIMSEEPEIRPMQLQAEPVISFPGLTIYPYQRQVFREKTEISLTHLEFSVLLLFQISEGVDF